MFESSTDRARKTIQLANQEAQFLGHDAVETGHLLLGMVKEKFGVAANALRAFDLNLKDLRKQVIELVPARGERRAWSRLPWDEATRHVLDCAHEEARHLNHDHVGTEHLLLALLNDRDGSAYRALANLRIDPEKVRNEVFRVLQKGAVDPEGWYCGPDALHERVRVLERKVRRLGILIVLVFFGVVGALCGSHVSGPDGAIVGAGLACLTLGLAVVLAEKRRQS